MKSFLVAVFLSLTLLANTIKPMELYINDDRDVFAVKEVFTDQLATRFLEKLFKHKGDTFYIYIDSPGGSVVALNTMIDYMLASDKQFVCIASSAASAAFILLQYCDRRYMLSNSGIVMSHEASAFAAGKLSEMEGMLNFFKSLVERIDKHVAKRMGITVKKYKRLISSELWLTYPMAKKYKLVDSHAIITCSGSLVDKEIIIEDMQCSLFGGCRLIKKAVSACPVINRERVLNDSSKD